MLRKTLACRLQSADLRSGRNVFEYFGIVLRQTGLGRLANAGLPDERLPGATLMMARALLRALR